MLNRSTYTIESYYIVSKGTTRGMRGGLLHPQANYINYNLKNSNPILDVYPKPFNYVPILFKFLFHNILYLMVYNIKYNKYGGQQ